MVTSSFINVELAIRPEPAQQDRLINPSEAALRASLCCPSCEVTSPVKLRKQGG
ncbi:hypothetical protein M407DRAFT_240637 [Tulasnella calospora MUT 4182]|uniref:Uncharacterized protein n=1 Tax=Tulasnella calospora MUT 4182 TaxID=1051891 RepID=A0A0C3LJS7_9AGAM|nr:hypothetical protein M407DRAFT_240637 [Tulasnella calospora MUT 4182]